MLFRKNIFASSSIFLIIYTDNYHLFLSRLFSLSGNPGHVLCDRRHLNKSQETGRRSTREHSGTSLNQAAVLLTLSFAPENMQNRAGSRGTRGSTPRLAPRQPALLQQAEVALKGWGPSEQTLTTVDGIRDKEVSQTAMLIYRLITCWENT